MGPTDKPDVCIYSISTDAARPEDGGEWRFELSNSYGKSSATCEVKVIEENETEQDEPPCFVEMLENIVAVEDENVVFQCKISGKPEPEVKWFRNDIPIDKEDSRQGRITIVPGIDGRNTLEIKEVKIRDAAIYNCKIKNKAGWSSCDAKLFVQEAVEEEYLPLAKTKEYTLVDQIKARIADETQNEADTLINGFVDCETMRKFLIKWKIDDDQTLDFTAHLKNKCAVEGSSASLNCLVKGIPPFKVRWYKNNKEIFEGRKYFIRNHHGILSLEITRAEESDTANYMCEVRTTQGKIYTSCYLQIEPVLELTNEVPIKPIFVKPMKRLTVNEGELIRFRVSVKAFPSPGFKWYRDGLEIHDSGRVTTEVFPNGVAQLIIENASVRDIGLYTCEAHNLAGRAKSMVRISVRDKYEAEIWKARSLNGVEVKTNGTRGQDAELARDVMKTSYKQRHESEVFSREPIFNRGLPKNITIRDRGRFIIQCSCNGCPRPTVNWYKDGELLTDGTRYHFLSVGDWVGLEVLEALPGDAGTYTVNIKNEAGEIMSSCVVDMKLPTANAKDLQTPTEIAETISSSSDGQVVISTEETPQIFDIAEIVPSFHLCNTESDWSAGIEKEVEVINAAESPSFRDTLPDIVTPVENEENIRLHCKASGHPAPNIVWYKDGQILENNDNTTGLWDPQTRIASLVINKATLSDTGTYSCVAYSEFGGHATTSTEVQIRALDSVESIESANKRSIPEFRVKLQDKTATPGSEVKLECIVEGLPPANVAWYKNDQPIPQDDDRYTITTSVEGLNSLLIVGMHLSENDCYRCKAVNECGAVSTRAYVLVQEQCEEIKDKDEIAPSIFKPVRGITANVGENAVFTCGAKGTPTPEMKWKKDAEEVNISERITIDVKDGKSTLTIQNATLDDAGIYVCIAENKGGKVDSSASLKVKDTVKESETAVKVKRDQLNNGLQKKTNDEAKHDIALDDIIVKQSNEVDSKDAAIALSAINNATPKDESRSSNVSVKETSESTHISENQVNRIDDNTITASGENEVPTERSHTSTLPDFKQLPKFAIRPLSQWVMSSSALNISFEVVTCADLEVSWFHNGEVVSDERFKVDVQERSN